MTEISSPPPPSAAENVADVEGDTGFSDLHPDVIESHILTRLDGPTLASAGSCSSAVRYLSSKQYLWSNICHSTWPSTSSPRVSRVISEFPGGGPRAFFSQAFTISTASNPRSNLSLHSTEPPSELISAVDIRYSDELIFSKYQETETLSGWFRCSPFRIDLLEPKNVVHTRIKHPDGDDKCTDIIINEMSLSWILIDPIGRRAVNLSSHKAVAVERHWLSEEVKIRFASILWAGDHHGHVMCEAVVTCGGSDVGEMQVREVSLQMEDMDGMHLNGKDSLVILHGALEGKKESGINRVQVGKRRYKEYLEMKKVRREMKLRREETLDMLCVAFGAFIFVAFCGFVLWR